MAYTSKARSVPKDLQQVPITGSDGTYINPGDGVVCGGAGRAAALVFGIYLGITGKGNDIRIHYEHHGRVWDPTKKQYVPGVTTKYMGGHRNNKYHRRICKIPAAQAHAAMQFQL